MRGKNKNPQKTCTQCCIVGTHCTFSLMRTVRIVKNNYIHHCLGLLFIMVLFVYQPFLPLTVLDFEIERQIGVLESGGEVVNETRSFDDESG